MVDIAPGLRLGALAEAGREGTTRSALSLATRIVVHAGMLAVMVPLVLAPSALVHVGVSVALVVGSGALARAARTERWARALIADLWAMAALCLLMVTSAVSNAPTDHHHTAGPAGPAVEVGVVLLWLAARLLLPSVRLQRASWHVIPTGVQLAAMLAMPLLLG